MGCSSSQGAKVVTTETKENGINEKMEGDRQYRKYWNYIFLEFEGDNFYKIATLIEKCSWRNTNMANTI